MTDEKQYLSAFERLIKPYRAVLSEAAQTIRTQDISNYPIFVAAQTEIELGILLLDAQQMPENWQIRASTLEEFHVKSLINTEKIEDFRALYNSHKSALCIFAHTDFGVKFLFVPIK
jgi:hypothetical protein